MIFLLFLSEAGLFYLYWHKELSLQESLLLHTVVILAALLSLYIAHKKKKNLSIPLVSLLFLALTGPFGAFGLLVQALLLPLLERMAPPKNEWFKELFPEELKSSFTQIFERVEAGWDDYSKHSDAPSFIDIFRIGTGAEKQAILDLFISDFRPSYAQILLQALEDPLNSVRIQAATAVQKIESAFEEKMKSIVAKQEMNPNQVHFLLDLATYYEEFSSLGILEKNRERKNQELALHFYHEYLKHDPDNRSIYFSVARLLYHKEDFVLYLNWCQEYEKKFQTLPQLLETWAIEALYKLHRYEEIVTREEERTT